MCRRCAVLGLAVLATALIAAPTASGQSRERLEMYTLEGSADRDPDAAGGVELAGVRQTGSGSGPTRC